MKLACGVASVLLFLSNPGAAEATGSLAGRRTLRHLVSLAAWRSASRAGIKCPKPEPCMCHCDCPITEVHDVRKLQPTQLPCIPRPMLLAEQQQAARTSAA